MMTIIPQDPLDTLKEDHNLHPSPLTQTLKVMLTLLLEEPPGTLRKCMNLSPGYNEKVIPS